MRRLLIGLFVVVPIALGQAQTRVGDPHAPGPAVMHEFVPVDDMLLHPEQLAELVGPARIRPQAYPLDYLRSLTTRPWDFGVIPYEFTSGYSAAQRDLIRSAMERWSRATPLQFVPRTTQTGFLSIVTTVPTGCSAPVGQTTRGVGLTVNLPSVCLTDRIIAHELGHAVGLYHEHQRADRDNYVTIDLSNIPTSQHFSYIKYTLIPIGPYDLGSVMHYDHLSGAINRTQSTIIPHDASWLTRIGVGDISEIDEYYVTNLYNQQLSDSVIRRATEPPRTRFDRAELLLTMERLHAFYMSKIGLQRPQGLSIGGRPDFLGIAQWLFDIYIPARSSGFSADAAFDVVVATITRTDEWRQKNTGKAPLTPASFRPAVSLSRDEYLNAMQRLDRFYIAPEGLQRPDGLSIAGGPDFLGIATWIFDIYLAERLNGVSASAAWTLTENSIRATDEWRRKH